MADYDWISDDEREILIISCLRKGPADEAELGRVCTWAETVRTDESLLELTLEGRILIRWHERDTEPTFYRVEEAGA